MFKGCKNVLVWCLVLLLPFSVEVFSDDVKGILFVTVTDETGNVKEKSFFIMGVNVAGGAGLEYDLNYLSALVFGNGECRCYGHGLDTHLSEEDKSWLSKYHIHSELLLPRGYRRAELQPEPEDISHDYQSLRTSEEVPGAGCHEPPPDETVPIADSLLNFLCPIASDDIISLPNSDQANTLRGAASENSPQFTPEPTGEAASLDGAGECCASSSPNGSDISKCMIALNRNDHGEVALREARLWKAYLRKAYLRKADPQEATCNNNIVVEKSYSGEFNTSSNCRIKLVLHLITDKETFCTDPHCNQEVEDW